MPPRPSARTFQRPSYTIAMVGCLLPNHGLFSPLLFQPGQQWHICDLHPGQPTPHADQSVHHAETSVQVEFLHSRLTTTTIRAEPLTLSTKKERERRGELFRRPPRLAPRTCLRPRSRIFPGWLRVAIDIHQLACTLATTFPYTAL